MGDVLALDKETPPTALQKLAHKVACDVTDAECQADCCPEKAGASCGVAGLDFLSLVELIGQIIQRIIENCPANDRRLLARARRPTFRQRVGLRAAVSEECRGCGCGRWRCRQGDIAAAVLENCGDPECCPDDELLGVAFEVRNQDWLAI